MDAFKVFGADFEVNKGIALLLLSFHNIVL